MAELIHAIPSQRYSGFGRLLDVLCKAFAIVGGAVFSVMALMSLVSVVGRAFFDAPVLGDFEVVEMMSAAGVSLVLPYTQWVHGHVIVDFVTTKAPPRFNAVLDGLANALLALASALITKQVAVSMVELRGNFDASMLLGIPTWYAYAAMVPAFALLALAAAYGAVTELRKSCQ